MEPVFFSGYPLITNIQGGPLYPFNILFFIFDFKFAWTALVMAQTLFAGINLYIFLLNRKLSKSASIFAAVSWSYSGFSIAWLTWGTIMQTVMWIPLALLAIDKLSQKNYEKIWIIVLFITLICLLTAGHLQVAFYGLVLILFYAIFFRLPKIILIQFFLILFTVNLIILFPFIRQFILSARLADVAFWRQDGWFLPWQNLIQFVIPDYYGNPATLNYWGVWNYGEHVGYAGVVTFLMFFISIFNVKYKTIFFWIATLCRCLILALPSYISQWPYKLGIPFLSSLQPTRLMCLIELAYIIIAAYGFDLWFRSKKVNIKIAFIVVLFIISLAWVTALGRKYVFTDLSNIQNAVISLRNLIFPTFIMLASTIVISISGFNKNFLTKIFLSGGLLIILTLELFRFGWKFTPFTESNLFFPVTKTITYLHAQPQPFRVVSISPELFPPNTLSYYGLESLDGYDSLFSERIAEFVAAINRGHPDIKPPFGFNRIVVVGNSDSTLLSYANIKYVVSLTFLDNPVYKLVFTEGNTKIYERNDVLPRFYFAQTVMNVSTKQAAINQMYSLNSKDFPAVVEYGPDIQLIRDDQAKIVINKYSSSFVELETSSTNGQFLVAGIPDDSNWQVFIDGQKVTSYRTNYIYKGLLVPQGKHLVSFVYKLINI